MSAISVSKKIIDEISNETKDEAVIDLAKDILLFEIENWKTDNPHFKKHFTELIARHAAKRNKT